MRRPGQDRHTDCAEQNRHEKKSPFGRGAVDDERRDPRRRMQNVESQHERDADADGYRHGSDFMKSGVAGNEADNSANEMPEYNGLGGRRSRLWSAGYQNDRRGEGDGAQWNRR